MIINANYYALELYFIVTVILLLLICMLFCFVIYYKVI